MTEDKTQWDRDIRLRKAARVLALYVIQSSLYITDLDVRDAVDDVLAITGDN